MTSNSSSSRREVSSRRVPVFQDMAKWLVRWGFTPNQVSLASAVVSALGMWLLWQASERQGFASSTMILAAIFMIQLRLLCNLIDGLMAIEGGLKTPSGELFNDVPDRFSDVLLIMGAAIFAAAMCGPIVLHVGWLTSIFALMTAYIRCLGASLTGQHDFSGVMAKQHRMFLLTLGGFGSIFENMGSWPRGAAFIVALVVIGVGSAFTSWQRLRKLDTKLKEAKS